MGLSMKTPDASTPIDPDADSAMVDGRQSETALELQRGVVRVLGQHAVSSVCELPLANGRRADVVGISEKGDVWIVEIKSSVIDFQTDQKWPDYTAYCDALFFAVKPDFPINILPTETGLIIADNYGGELVRKPTGDRLPAARRKAMTLRFAHAAARRLSQATEPSLRRKVWQGRRDPSS